MRKNWGVLILGCGYWGVNQVRVFHELPQSTVVAICDQDVERLNEMKSRFPDAILTPDLNHALSLDGIDAVVISTGATTHYRLGQQCLAAGKHVLIEKPMTTDVGDSQRLIDLADSHGLLLMVGHTFLFNPAVHIVREHIEREKIGDIYYLYSRRTNLGPIRHDVNAIWDLAPHDISIFNYLLDSTPIWVSAVGSKVLRNSREDVGFISLGYKNNVIGNIHVSWTDPNKVRELVVVGSNRRVVFNDMNSLEQVRIFEKGVCSVEQEAPSYGEYKLQIRDGAIISPCIDHSEPLKKQAIHFLACLTHGTTPLTDGYSGLQVVQVMEAVERSLAYNGVPQAVGALDDVDVEPEKQTMAGFS